MQAYCGYGLQRRNVLLQAFFAFPALSNVMTEPDARDHRHSAIRSTLSGADPPGSTGTDLRGMWFVYVERLYDV
jgi:hypothetical protein